MHWLNSLAHRMTTESSLEPSNNCLSSKLYQQTSSAQGLLFFFFSAQFVTNPIQKFWRCLSHRCYLAQRPVIMRRLLLLINSCNYGGLLSRSVWKSLLWTAVTLGGLLLSLKQDVPVCRSNCHMFCEWSHSIKQAPVNFKDFQDSCFLIQSADSHADAHMHNPRRQFSTLPPDLSSGLGRVRFTDSADSVCAWWLHSVLL